MSSSIKSKAIDIERKALKYEFNKASLPVKKRLHERLVQLAVSHPKLTNVEVHEIALKDPKYIKDELLLEGLLELYKAADKKLQAKEGATKVGSGLFEGKTSHEDILKALEELKHDKDGAEHHKPSLSAAKVHHTVHPKPHLPRPKPHLVHPHPHPLVKPHLVHHNASASHNLGKPSGGWAALFAKFRTKQPEHAAVKEDDGAGVASSWVSATSVGVVVAMCACVAAFAVVRRRQRQSEPAAPRADGYATLV